MSHRRFKILMNVHLDVISSAAEPSVTKHHGPKCHARRLVCCLQVKVKVTVKSNIIKIWLFNTLSELLILLQVNLVWWHIIKRWIVLWKDWIARSKSQKRLRIPANVHLDDISSAAGPSVTKLGMVMQHYVPKCHHARRLVCCLQLLEIRKKYFEEKSLYSLFWNVIPEVVFDFLREIGVFYKV